MINLMSEDETREKIPTVAIVIPLFFSSGALSISSKAIALAFPSSDKTYITSKKMHLRVHVNPKDSYSLRTHN